MSTEHEAGESSQKQASTKATQQYQHQATPQPTSQQQSSSRTLSSTSQQQTPHGTHTRSIEAEKPAVRPDQISDNTTSPSTPDDPRARPRQVIAVSASKGPAAFFNLARKFLVTDEMCDLSALEGAIVAAADAAHLLERSKLATIVRVQTSYVTVEPKRRRQVHSPPPHQQHRRTTTDEVPAAASSPETEARTTAAAGGRELRRARIVITVKRTESYKQWLEDNPLQAVIAGDGDEEEDEAQTIEAASVPRQER